MPEGEHADSIGGQSTPRKTSVWNQMLAIAVLRGDELEPRGTGFLIGQSLALTATHVINDVFMESSCSESSVVAQQIVDRGEATLLWHVRDIYRFPSAAEGDDHPLDIALLRLKPHGDRVAAIEDHRRWFFELNIATPKVGQRVVAYGFSKSEVQRDPAEPFVFNLAHAFHRVEGFVSDVQWPHRDLGLLSFPCFAVAADFEPGMSGGPVFNDRDQVCGVVSSGGIAGISWASVLWPALGISLDGAYLLDHARKGTIRAKNHHCVSLLPNDEGPFPTVTFDPNVEVL